MPNLTAQDMASRTMRKGWVDRTDEEDAQDAAEVAAERTKKSVKRAPRASAEGAFQFRKLYDRKYDNRFKDEED